MLMLRSNVTRIFESINKSSLYYQPVCHFNKKIDTVSKRGSMLKQMLIDRDKRKNWHFELTPMPTKSKVRIFEKVHRPHRRRAVLNSLFISNITDVISTGDVAPDLINYGIEITGVSVSQCMRTLNVFWQIPPSNYDSSVDIEKMLAIAAPKIRAELISRNVLGKVPHIFFLRDATNDKISEYELAVKKMETEPKTDIGLVPDDSFHKDLYKFKDNRKSKVSETKSKMVEDKPTETDVPICATPCKPKDMKNDVGGLDHTLLMDKVIAFKKKSKNPVEQTNVISSETVISADDLFNKVPGVCFQAGESNETKSRDAILKQFRIQRKMLKENKVESTNSEHFNFVEDNEEEFIILEDSGDFIDDDETIDDAH